MRTVGSNGEATGKALREAGIQLIAQHGYEAMNLRMLAGEVGIQAGSLYNHIKNKQTFLQELLSSIMRELIVGLDERLAQAESDPLAKLYAVVSFHIETHCARRDEVFIGNMELRSLTVANRQIVVDLRSQYEDRLVNVLKSGKRKGVFTLDDPKVATFALIAMLAGVSTWYKPGGRFSIERLVQIYFGLTLRMFGVPPAAQVKPRRTRQSLLRSHAAPAS